MLDIPILTIILKNKVLKRYVDDNLYLLHEGEKKFLLMFYVNDV